MNPRGIDNKIIFSIASYDEYENAATSLSRHQGPELQLAFKDKVERYTRKQDRDVILARIEDDIIGYCLVIDQLTPPDSLSPEFFQRLSSYGCITGLGVNPEWRENGIGASLVRQGLEWAKDHGLPGIWLRTRVMAEWYKKHLQFERVGSMIVKKTVKKAVLAKAL